MGDWRIFFKNLRHFILYRSIKWALLSAGYISLDSIFKLLFVQCTVLFRFASVDTWAGGNVLIITMQFLIMLYCYGNVVTSVPDP